MKTTDDANTYATQTQIQNMFSMSHTQKKVIEDIWKADIE